MRSKEFHELMQQCLEIHDKKSHDYAGDNTFSNFEQTAELVELFKKPIDQVFVCMIGVKLSRLSQLLNGKNPVNESIDDSFMDLVNYCALWGAYYRRYKLGPQNTEKVNNYVDLSTQYSEARDRDYNSGIPVICIDCDKGSPDNKIKHAVHMHSAIFNKTQSSLHYPARGLFLLTPDFWKENKS